MKRYFLPIIIFLGVFLTTGCDMIGDIIEDDWIVDWAPVNIYITATDDKGNSIISPDMPGMTLTFKGETFTVKDWETRYTEVPTRAYLATLWGLYAQPNSDSSVKTPYRLYFGEIDGAADMDEDIVLKWPDGSSDTIHYHCSDHKNGKNFSCKRSWKLNGKAHKGDLFSFTGKNL